MKKSIKTAMASAIAVGFIACSDNEGASTAPQDSVPTVSDTVQVLPDTTKLIGDSISTPTLESKDTLQEAYYESLMKGDFISNLIAVDCFSKEMGLGPCLGHRDTLSTGKILKNNFNGFDRFIGCEQGDTTLLHYNISISYKDVESNDMRIEKSLIGNDEHVVDVFQKDCNQEGGTYSLDEDGKHLCTILPADSTDDFFINYTDPNWAKYAGTAINICKDLPVSIEPEASEPETNVQPIIVPDGSQASTNWIKTGECKANALAKVRSVSEVSVERKATITKISEGSYEIMIPDVSDYCSISTGVVRYLAGEDLTIQYDKNCEKHEEYYHQTDTTKSTITTTSILYQYDESCSLATISKCVCTSDHYFQVNEELLMGAKYVHFDKQKYTIENPLER